MGKGKVLRMGSTAGVFSNYIWGFTKNVNVKKQRRFDRLTVIFKLKSKKFCMRLKYIQSIIKMHF